jgi:hypothetical protein
VIDEIGLVLLAGAAVVVGVKDHKKRKKCRKCLYYRKECSFLERHIPPIIITEPRPRYPDIETPKEFCRKDGKQINLFHKCPLEE